MTIVKPYALTISEVAQSGRSCVLIDDSGTPGQIAGSEYLDPKRKTWVAALVPHTQVREVCEQIPGALAELAAHTGASEFHFMEIFRGSGPFKTVAFEVRPAIFAFMRHIFARYMFLVIVQTFDANDLRELQARAKLPEKVGPFDMSSPSDAALLFLLIRVKWFLQQHPHDFVMPTFAVLDEGFRPAGRSIKIPSWNVVLHNSAIYTASSSSFFPIQLADYAAFCVARSQWLLNKERRSRSDDAFLKIMADIRINLVNPLEAIIDFRNWTPQDYGKLIEHDRERKGLPSKHSRDN